MRGFLNHQIAFLLSIVLLLGACKKDPSGNTITITINKPPLSNAGPDQEIILPIDSTYLNGSASNDPEGAIKEWRWKKISGPVSFNIKYSDSSKTSIKNLAKGVYQFELTVLDNGGLSGMDTVQITVNDPLQTNRPPVANAGPNQTIFLPVSSVTIDGVGSVDPDNNITSYQWVKISDPSSFNITNATAMQTQVTNLTDGNYLLELIVTDAGGLSGRDTVQIIVQAFIDESKIYAVGNDYSLLTSIPTPFYWHNGTKFNLTPNGHAGSIFVSGSDVYVAGYHISKPCYWKNGQKTDLPTSSSSLSVSGTASSIVVSGSDIYVAGHINKASVFPDDGRPYTPCYWKNGLRIDLSQNRGFTSSIFLSGADIYIAGDSLTNDNNFPGYWKNGQRINFENSGNAGSIFVSGTDVYVAGYQGGKACYWKNGIKTGLDGTEGYYASSIFVSGGDVYIAGNRINSNSQEVPCYWKNGVRTDLSNGSYNCNATSIFVSGTDVYVAGGDYLEVGQPYYWKNGQRREILGVKGYLTGIFVKP